MYGLQIMHICESADVRVFVSIYQDTNRQGAIRIGVIIGAVQSGINTLDLLSLTIKKIYYQLI